MKIKENLARNKIRRVTLILLMLALFLFPCNAKAGLNDSGGSSGDSSDAAINTYVSWMSSGKFDERFDEYNYHQGAGDPITNKALLDKLAELERVGGATVAPYLLKKAANSFVRTVDPETGPQGCKGSY